MQHQQQPAAREPRTPSPQRAPQADHDEVHDLAGSDGGGLAAARALVARQPLELSAVSLFADDGVAEEHDALGVTIGSDIHLAAEAFGAGGVDRQVLGHELVHAAQFLGDGDPAGPADLEAEAEALASDFAAGRGRPPRLKAPRTPLRTDDASEPAAEPALTREELVLRADVQRSPSQLAVFFPTADCLGHSADTLQWCALFVILSSLTDLGASAATYADDHLGSYAFSSNLPDVITIETVTDEKIPIVAHYFALQALLAGHTLTDLGREMLDVLEHGTLYEHFFDHVVAMHRDAAAAHVDDPAWEAIGVTPEAVSALTSGRARTLFVTYCFEADEAADVRAFFDSMQPQLDDAQALRELDMRMYEAFLDHASDTDLSNVIIDFVLVYQAHLAAEKDRLDEEMDEAMSTPVEVGIGNDPVRIYEFVATNLDTSNAVHFDGVAVYGGDTVSVDGRDLYLVYVSGNHVCYWDQEDGLVKYLGKSAFTEWVEFAPVQEAGRRANEFLFEVLLPTLTDPQQLLMLLLSLGLDAAIALAEWAIDNTPDWVKDIIVDLMLDGVQVALAILEAAMDIALFVVDVITSDEFAAFLDAVATLALWGPYGALLIWLFEEVTGLDGPTASGILALLDEYVLRPVLELLAEPLADLVRAVLGLMFPEGTGYYLQADVIARLPLPVPVKVGSGSYVGLSNAGNGIFRLQVRGEAMIAVGTGKGAGGNTGSPAGGGLSADMAYNLQVDTTLMAFHEYEFPVVNDMALVAMLVALIGAENHVGLASLFGDALDEIDPDNYASITKYEVKNTASISGEVEVGGTKDGETSTYTTDSMGTADKRERNSFPRKLLDPKATLFAELAFTYGLGFEMQTTEWSDDAENRVPTEVATSLYIQAGVVSEVAGLLPIPVPIPSGEGGIKVTWTYREGSDGNVEEVGDPVATLYGTTGEMDIYEGAAYEAGVQFDHEALQAAEDLDDVRDALTGAEIKYRTGLDYTSRKWEKSQRRQDKLTHMLPAGYRQVGFEFEAYVHLEYALSRQDVLAIVDAVVAFWDALTSEENKGAMLIDAILSILHGSTEGLPEGIADAVETVFAVLGGGLNKALIRVEKGFGVSTDGKKKDTSKKATKGKGDLHVSLGVGQSKEFDILEMLQDDRLTPDELLDIAKSAITI